MGSLAISALPGIVEEVYDSIAETSRWQGALETICRASDACLATLAVFNTATNLPRFSVACGCFHL